MTAFLAAEPLTSDVELGPAGAGTRFTPRFKSSQGVQGALGGSVMSPKIQLFFLPSWGLYLERSAEQISDTIFWGFLDSQKNQPGPGDVGFARFGTRTAGCWMCIQMFPCWECCKVRQGDAVGWKMLEDWDWRIGTMTRNLEFDHHPQMLQYWS